MGSLKHNGLLRLTKEKGYYSSPPGIPRLAFWMPCDFMVLLGFFLVTIFEKYTRSRTVKR